MEISNDTREFANKLVKSMIEKGIIESEDDLTSELVDIIIEAVRIDAKNRGNEIK